MSAGVVRRFVSVNSLSASGVFLSRLFSVFSHLILTVGIMKLLQKLLLLLLLAFPATLLLKGEFDCSIRPRYILCSALQSTLEIRKCFAVTTDDVMAEDEDDEAEVEDDDNTELTEEKEEEEEEALVGEMKASPNADTSILFVKGEGERVDLTFTSGSYSPGDMILFYRLWTRSSLTHSCPSSLLFQGNVFQDAVFNQTVTITEREDGLDGETIFLYVFLSGLGLLLVVGLHQLLESRKRRRPAAKVEMGTSNHNDVDMSWIPQETLNQINKASPRQSPRKRTQKRSAGSDE
ncbi:translocon-associated protein subunit alpha-like [Sinocyclocheilus rhinocerous]|uniref:translocon-associated protein subunit alpha-like n=1 Tax=Sinocyclocheilus rhinocerous TaxID=307959 RepID=UPI0007B94348|nr:PREDICTED: translocon-associated protein subunit alpha-like [Sinocyclocheilus rhinocerous]